MRQGIQENPACVEGALTIVVAHVAELEGFGRLGRRRETTGVRDHERVRVYADGTGCEDGEVEAGCYVTAGAGSEFEDFYLEVYR